MTTMSHHNSKWRRAKIEARGFDIEVKDDWKLQDIRDAITAKQDEQSGNKTKTIDIKPVETKRPVKETREIVPPTVVEQGETNFNMHHHSHVTLPDPVPMTRWEMFKAAGSWVQTFCFGISLGVISTLLLMGKIT